MIESRVKPPFLQSARRLGFTRISPPEAGLPLCDSGAGSFLPLPAPAGAALGDAGLWGSLG